MPIPPTPCRAPGAPGTGSHVPLSADYETDCLSPPRRSAPGAGHQPGDKEYAGQAAAVRPGGPPPPALHEISPAPHGLSEAECLRAERRGKWLLEQRERQLAAEAKERRRVRAGGGGRRRPAPAPRRR